MSDKECAICFLLFKPQSVLSQTIIKMAREGELPKLYFLLRENISRGFVGVLLGWWWQTFAASSCLFWLTGLAYLAKQSCDVCCATDKNGSRKFAADKFKHELSESGEEVRGSRTMILGCINEPSVRVICTLKASHGNPWREKQIVNVMK